MPLLEVEGLHAGYDGIPVLHGVDLFVDDGEAVALRGRTGAGKTTTLLAVAGLLGRTAGRILYDGRPTTRSDPATLVERGLVLVPQGRHVFGGLDVEENLRVGAWSRRHERSAARSDLDRVFEVFPRLADRRKRPAGSLSAAEQQMLAIARGLMADPRLLLIDEPSEGLPPVLAEEVFATLRGINEEGATLLVAGRSPPDLALAGRSYVLDNGRIVAGETGNEMLLSAAPDVGRAAALA